MNYQFDYEVALITFQDRLTTNRAKAYQKKQEHLQRVLQIFTQFVTKCGREIDRIIESKIQRLSKNYARVLDLFGEWSQREQERKLVTEQFLVKPFEKFPFSGNKNEKMFQEQYALIQKAALLIEQTLVDSFNEDEVPCFDSPAFFKAIQDYGLGDQSLTRLKIDPKALSLEPLPDIRPLQRGIRAVKSLGDGLAVLVGDERYLQIWDLQERQCVRRVYLDIIAEVTCLGLFEMDNQRFLAVGFGDQCPEIWFYSCWNWKRCGCLVGHTRKLTRLVQAANVLVSGGADGQVGLHQRGPLRTVENWPHISGVEQILTKGRFVYVLLRCASLCEYEMQEGGESLAYRRTLATSHISMLRAPALAGNLCGVACHIYGLSRVQVTRKYRLQESGIINVADMIADFVVIESKQESNLYALCAFQNSSALRLYSLSAGQLVWEIAPDYLGEAGAAEYLPKIELIRAKDRYLVLIVNHSEFQDAPNSLRIYQLII